MLCMVQDEDEQLARALAASMADAATPAQQQPQQQQPPQQPARHPAASAAPMGAPTGSGRTGGDMDGGLPVASQGYRFLRRLDANELVAVGWLLVLMPADGLRLCLYESIDAETNYCNAAWRCCCSEWHRPCTHVCGASWRAGLCGPAHHRLGQQLLVQCGGLHHGAHTEKGA